MTAGRTPIRRTVRAPIQLEGRGLFTGATASATILERPAGGITFRRVDLPARPEIPALATHVGSDPRLPGRNTILALDPSRPPAQDNPAVLTVEHVLSALAGAGITDATVDVTGPELPIGDGSAAFITEAINSAGTRDLAEEAAPIIIRDRLTVRDDRAVGEIVAEPGSGGLELSYTLDYGPSGPPAQTFSWTFDEGSYPRDIAPARTFCLDHEAAALRRAGLFSWVSPRDMLVLDSAGRPIENSLRFSDEPARHKLLDLLGDLSLAGAPLRGRITARRSGHALNARMARQLLDLR